MSGPPGRPPADGEGDDVARTLLAAVGERPDDEAAHEAFLEYCARTGQVVFAARAYRDRLARHRPDWQVALAAGRLERPSPPSYRVSTALTATLVILVLLLAAMPYCLRGKTVRTPDPAGQTR